MSQVAFDPAEHRAGKWLKFNLAKEGELRLLVVADNQVRVAVIGSKEEVDFYIRKAKQAADDGRFVGVFVKGGKLRVPGSRIMRKDANGEPILDHNQEPIFDTTPESFVRIPDAIAPQRAIEVNGHRNLDWKADGDSRVHTMLIPLSACKDVELLLTRDDIPTAHNATLDENFDPKETLRR